MLKSLLNIFVALFFVSCHGQSTNQNWVIDSSSKPQETIYHHGTEDQCIVKVFSIKEIEKQAFRKIDANGRKLEKDQLEFALSVLWIDTDEMKVHNKGANNPILWGNGSSENGEVEFAIAYQGEGTNRRITLLLTPPGKFETLGGIDILQKNDFNLQSSGRQITNAPIKKQTPNKISKSKTYSSKKKYPLPYGKKNRAGKTYWEGWTYKDDFHASAAANDPSAPRFALEVVKGSSVRNFKAAINDALRKNNVKSASYLPLEKMDVSKKMLGNDMFFTVGKSKLAGREAVLFLRVEKVKNATNYFVLVIEIPKTTYIEWGGIGSIMLATQVIKTMESIPKKRKNQIANATPKQQVAFYESAYTSIMQQYYMGIMMTKSQTLMRMQELNYDLLLGGDITDPIIGN